MERMGGSQKYWRHPGQTLNYKGDYKYIYIFARANLGIISRHVLINVRASGTADMHDFE
jgi:hypothetical protein